jgi:hypothetical protein
MTLIFENFANINGIKLRATRNAIHSEVAL